MNGADKFARDAFGNDAEYYFTHEFTKPAAQIGKRSSINNITEGALNKSEHAVQSQGCANAKQFCS